MQNTVIPPNFLVCKFCGKPQNLHTRKLGEIMVFYKVFVTKKKKKKNKKRPGTPKSQTSVCEEDQTYQAFAWPI